MFIKRRLVRMRLAGACNYLAAVSNVFVRTCADGGPACGRRVAFTLSCFRSFVCVCFFCFRRACLRSYFAPENYSRRVLTATWGLSARAIRCRLLPLLLFGDYYCRDSVYIGLHTCNDNNRSVSERVL